MAKIRIMEKEDLEGLLVVADEFIADGPRPDYCDAWFNKNEYENYFFNPKEYDILVAENQGKIIGYMSGYKGAECYEIGSVYVLKNFRQEGIAKQLTKEITALAKNKGNRQITSWTLEENTGSVKLHETLGWDINQKSEGYVQYIQDFNKIKVVNYCKIFLNEFANIIDEIKKEDPDGEAYDDELKTIEYYQERYSSKGNSRMLIATNGIELQGFIAGGPINEKEYDVEMIYVAQEFRQNGVAKKLNEKLADFAKRKGYKSIVADVLKSNISSMKSYDKLEWNRKESEYEGMEIFKYIKQLAD